MVDNRPRIISGILKGKKISIPEGIRPVTDRVKRSIFDTISGYEKDTIILDIYCGSGNFGIEALSRGASECVFVDHDEKCIKILNKNLEALRINNFKIYEKDANAFLRKYTGGKFDLVFIDPPFTDIPKFRLNELLKVIKDDSLIIFKVNTGYNPKIPEEIEIILEKKLGANTVYFMRKKSS